MSFRAATKALTTAFQDIYTVSAGVSGAMHGLVFGNTTAGELTVSLELYRSETAVTSPMGSVKVPAGQAFSWPKPINMLAGDIVRAKGSSLGITADVSFYEQDASPPVAVGWTPRGEYNAGANYNKNDVVDHAGGSWISKVDDNVGNTPQGGVYWMVNSLKGETGDPANPMATLPDLRAGTSAAKSVSPQNLAQAAAFVPMTFAPTVAWDLLDGFNRYVTLTGDCVLGNPANMKDGDSGVILVIQDDEGGHILAYGTAWAPLQEIPDNSTDHDAVDMISYIVRGTKIYFTMQGPF